MKKKKITTQLLEWYRCNKREMPWRQTTDPYHIWVSEIMLQQTQVDVVIPYYERFMKQFPDMQTLAGAGEDDILSAWQGLGYYSRVRNLQNGVREVLASYGGKVPDRQDLIKSLPGIGPYTAGAILSIAYGKKETAVDGNVLRVISRLHAIREPVKLSQTLRHITALVQEMMPDKDPGEFNQALMELGALVCIPKSPRCRECPWTGECAAKRADVQNILPVRRGAARQKIVNIAAGMLCDQGKILVRRRPEKGLLAGMWELPSAEVAGDEVAEEQMKHALIKAFDHQGYRIVVNGKWTEIRHVFSHREWRLGVWKCEGTQERKKADREDWRWISRDESRLMNWAGPYRKISDAWMNENNEVEG